MAGETTQLGGQWRTLSITGGSAGVAGLLLVAVSQALVQVGGGEPAFDASGEEILRFLEARHDTLYAIGTFLGLLAAVALACFVSVVCVVLRETEGRPAWRSAFAFTSAIAFVVLLMSPGWELAGYRTDEGVDPQIARYAFDMGNLGFANAWVALAGFLAAAGWIIVGTPPLPSWLGWVAIAAAIGFLLGRAFWTTSVWLVPYAVFWIWVVALSIYLFRGRVPGRAG
ncbi:hypothetical protein [Kribbella sindirgiensis]|uniref:DUF4386 family protein n=1 Tax=Kribbella sindirgiensis TaxID=1124744 RepID=A0A4R0I318_9ACTN|nr:hypothetical protein [Kribbella sindirgiensis]TCC19881.1 hypothetical protein E0H50_37225 [Kribbella sindirgiensis]